MNQCLRNQHPGLLWVVCLSLWMILCPAIRAENNGVVRLDPALDELISPDAKVEKVADGFLFTEGPVWVQKGAYLLFSDIPANVINKWNEGDGKVSIVLAHSGFTGSDPTGIGKQQTNGHDTFFNIGSNGITLDRHGRVVFSVMGDRQIVRLEKDGRRTVLASRYEGKRLNSTNDLVYKRDGTLYFTDPPSGLRDGDTDPKKELPFDGIFMLRKSQLILLAKDFANPNGLAFSPDEKTLYVDDTTRKRVMRFDVQADDSVANERLFVDMAPESPKAPGNPDGMKVDVKGNVYCSGPGGVWIVSADGKHLGTILTPQVVSNLTFGEADGKTLFITARTAVYRIPMRIAGIRP
jgi:gluconolactonase